MQGGRSCAGARVAPAEKFGLGHTLFCRNLRTFFGDLWAKKVSFWVKTVLRGQEVHYNMVYIAYFTELKSKI